MGLWGHKGCSYQVLVSPTTKTLQQDCRKRENNPVFRSPNSNVGRDRLMVDGVLPKNTHGTQHTSIVD